MQHAIWQQAIDHIAVDMSPQLFNTWILPLSVMEESDHNHVRLLAPNYFVRDWVMKNYREQLTSLMRTLSGVENFWMAIDVLGQPSEQMSLPHPHRSDDGDSPTRHSSADTHKTPHNADPLDNITAIFRKSITHKYTFDSFIAGKPNELAFAAAQQVGKKWGSTEMNPLLIYGSTSLGKTHLLNAVGNELLRHHPRLKVIYTSSERFVRDMVHALELKTINDFKYFYRSLDVLLIDDIHFLARAKQTQEEFLHLFNALMDADKQVVLTCDRHPKDVQGLDGRLKSRFNWGLSAMIEPPDEENRIAILQHKATTWEFDLPLSVAQYIAQRIDTNVRDLEGALKRVLASSRMKNRPVDMDMAHESLSALVAVQHQQINIDHIIQIVADYYRIQPSDMKSAKRSRSVAYPRHMAMALAQCLTDHSLPEIGRFFGGRDHTTVLHACRKVRRLYSSHVATHREYKNLLNKIRS